MAHLHQERRTLVRTLIQILLQGCARFAEIFAKLCGTPEFLENMHDSFSCFYNEIAYSNFNFCGTHTLIFLAKRAHPRSSQLGLQSQSDSRQCENFCIV